MKSLLSLLLLTVLATAQANAPAGSTSSIPVDQQNANKARALLEQAIQALGGPAYLGIQDMEQQGRTYSFYHGRANSYGVEYWLYYKYPDKQRMELTKKRDVVEIFNGDKGYEITYKGTRAQDPKDMAVVLRRRLYSLDWVLRKWLNEPGVALFYDGAAVAAEKPADQVSLINAKNQGVTLYLDSTTHLPIKKSFSWRDPTDRQRNTEEEVYDAYREVQGVMTPFSVTRFYNGDISNQRFVNSVTYNQGVEDSKFEGHVTYQANSPHVGEED
jgi:hypothetical protein